MKSPLYSKKQISKISDHMGRRHEFKEIIKWLGKDTFDQERRWSSVSSKCPLLPQPFCVSEEGTVGNSYRLWGFLEILSCFHCVKWLIESNFVADIWLHILCFPSLRNFFMFCHTWVCCDVTKRELGLTTNTEVLKRNVKAPESLDNDKVLWFNTSQQLHSMQLTHTSLFLHLLGRRIRKS